MKQVIAFIFSVTLFSSIYSQGKIKRITIQSKALTNMGGESDLRTISIYLPPNYNTSPNRFPVVYYFHGFLNNDSINPNMKLVLDLAIEKGKIRPFILVIPNNSTIFDGSFYSNSSLTGNWEEYNTHELIRYIDAHYKTIPQKESRGIAGHSMGGYGAFKLAMLHPDLYQCVYAMSPGLLAMVKEFGANSGSFKELQKIKTVEELRKTYYPKVLVAVGRAWTPNPHNPPFYCDMPFNYIGDSLVVHQSVLDKWEKEMPVYQVGNYASNLRQLKAIKLDWGRNDAARFPIQIGMLSQRLENLGINHFAEEYIGDHVNKIWTMDGRVLNELLPFFNDFLHF